MTFDDCIKFRNVEQTIFEWVDSSILLAEFQCRRQPHPFSLIAATFHCETFSNIFSTRIAFDSSVAAQMIIMIIMKQKTQK